MQRPVHATVAGILTLVWALYSLVFGALYAQGILQLPELQLPTPTIDPATYRTLTGAVTMLTAALWGPIGVGLLRLKRWARTLALVLYGMGLPMNLLFAVSIGRTLGSWLLVVQIASIVTAAMVIWLLLQTPAREAFGVARQPLAAAPEVRERPAGVKFLVVLCVLGAIGSLASGLVYGLTLPFLDTNMKSSPETLRLMRFSMVAGTLPWAAGYALCAVGLWRLRNWARILAIVFAVLWLLPPVIVAAGAIFVLAKAPNVLGAVIMLIMIFLMGAIPAWVLWYLSRPHIKRAFGAAPRRPFREHSANN